MIFQLPRHSLNENVIHKFQSSHPIIKISPSTNQPVNQAINRSAPISPPANPAINLHGGGIAAAVLFWSSDRRAHCTWTARTSRQNNWPKTSCATKRPRTPWGERAQDEQFVSLLSRHRHARAHKRQTWIKTQTPPAIGYNTSHPPPGRPATCTGTVDEENLARANFTK